MKIALLIDYLFHFNLCSGANPPAISGHPISLARRKSKWRKNPRRNLSAGLLSHARLLRLRCANKFYGGDYCRGIKGQSSALISLQNVIFHNFARFLLLTSGASSSQSTPLSDRSFRRCRRVVSLKRRKRRRKILRLDESNMLRVCISGA